MEFRIADTFTDSLGRLTAQEQKAVKTTAFDLQLDPTSNGSTTFQKDAELSTAAFHRSIIRTFGHTDNRFHLLLKCSFRNIINQLFDDVHTFHDFFHTYHVACE